MKTKKKTQEKSVMSLSEFNKRKLTAWISLFVMYVYEDFVGEIYTDSTVLSAVIPRIMTVLALVVVIRFANSFISYRIEKNDELSIENMNKAHSAIGAVFLVVFAVGFLVSQIVIDDSVTVTVKASFLTDIFFMMLSVYFSLESGLFLLFDRTPKSAEEDE
jgi:hypothetical protein